MSAKDLLDEAMKLKSEERFTVVEGLINSLDEPERRLNAYREENLEGIPMEEIFKED